MHPVIYAPNHEVIGSASTQRGALQCAARKISKLACERLTASLRETCDRSDYPDGTKAWFVGLQLNR